MRGEPLTAHQQGICLLADFREQFGQTPSDDACHAFTQTDVYQQFIQRFATCEAQQFVPQDLRFRIDGGHVLNTFGAQSLRQEFFAQIFRLGLRHGFEMVADFGAGPSRAHKT